MTTTGRIRWALAAGASALVATALFVGLDNGDPRQAPAVEPPPVEDLERPQHAVVAWAPDADESTWAPQPETGSLDRTAAQERYRQQAEEDEAISVANRTILIETNIEQLHAAALAAERDGFQQRADLMRLRAERLELRLAEELGEDLATP